MAAGKGERGALAAHLFADEAQSRADEFPGWGHPLPNQMGLHFPAR